MTGDDVDLTLFARKLAERRAAEAEAAKKAEPTLEEVFDDDLIPDDGPGAPDKDPELDRIIDAIGIAKAYQWWCNKSKIDLRRKRVEGIKVSCPVPGHADRDPSAWINTEKNLWHCAVCSMGGDVYDLAAFYFGFPVPGYKEGSKFHELRKKIAEFMGYSFMKAPGLAKPIMVSPEEKTEILKETAAKVKEAESEDDVVVPIFEDDELKVPELKWQEIVEENTFLRTYIEQCSKDDAANEFHFWNGLMALGMAIGREVTLWDQQPVFGNLFLCLLGPTGDGKSRSFAHLKKLLMAALPYRPDEPGNKGTQLLGSPASAEVLIHQFSKPVYDPDDPKKIKFYAPVRGLIEFNELSSLTGRAARKGNVIKPTLMEFYDGSPLIQTASMTHGIKRAENPFGSCFTTTQPKALKDLLRESDAHSGFLNRWVFAAGTPKQRFAIGGEQIDILPAVKPLKDIQGWAGFGKEVVWSDLAIKIFTEFFHDILHPAQRADETGLLTRMDLLAKKLILLLSVNLRSAEVSGETVEKVTSMFSYLTAAYGIPAAHIGSTISSEVQNELIRHISRYTARKGGISLRELNKCISKKKFPLDVVSKALKYMTELGIIEAFTTSGIGRPTAKYRVAS